MEEPASYYYESVVAEIVKGIPPKTRTPKFIIDNRQNISLLIDTATRNLSIEIGYYKITKSKTNPKNECDGILLVAPGSDIFVVDHMKLADALSFFKNEYTNETLVIPEHDAWYRLVAACSTESDPEFHWERARQLLIFQICEMTNVEQTVRGAISMYGSMLGYPIKLLTMANTGREGKDVLPVFSAVPYDDLIFYNAVPSEWKVLTHEIKVQWEISLGTMENMRWEMWKYERADGIGRMTEIGPHVMSITEGLRYYAYMPQKNDLSCMNVDATAMVQVIRQVNEIKRLNRLPPDHVPFYMAVTYTWPYHPNYDLVRPALIKALATYMQQHKQLRFGDESSLFGRMLAKYLVMDIWWRRNFNIESDKSEWVKKKRTPNSGGYEIERKYQKEIADALGFPSFARHPMRISFLSRGSASMERVIEVINDDMPVWQVHGDCISLCDFPMFFTAPAPPSPETLDMPNNPTIDYYAPGAKLIYPINGSKTPEKILECLRKQTAILPISRQREQGKTVRATPKQELMRNIEIIMTRLLKSPEDAVYWPIMIYEALAMSQEFLGLYGSSTALPDLFLPSSRNTSFMHVASEGKYNVITAAPWFKMHGFNMGKWDLVEPFTLQKFTRKPGREDMMISSNDPPTYGLLAIDVATFVPAIWQAPTFESLDDAIRVEAAIRGRKFEGVKDELYRRLHMVVFTKAPRLRSTLHDGMTLDEEVRQAGVNSKSDKWQRDRMVGSTIPRPEESMFDDELYPEENTFGEEMLPYENTFDDEFYNNY